MKKSHYVKIPFSKEELFLINSLIGYRMPTARLLPFEYERLRMLHVKICGNLKNNYNEVNFLPFS